MTGDSFQAPEGAACLTSHDLLRIRSGDHIEAGGQPYVAMSRAEVVCEGKPGPGRVRIEVLLLTPAVHEWVRSKGLHSATRNFKSRVLRGDRVTSFRVGIYL